MAAHRIVTTAFASVYPLYVQKAERKGRTKAEVDEVIRWLTGYDQAGLERQIVAKTDFQTFFAEAPRISIPVHRSSRAWSAACVWKTSTIP